MGWRGGLVWLYMHEKQISSTYLTAGDMTDVAEHVYDLSAREAETKDPWGLLATNLPEFMNS